MKRWNVISLLAQHTRAARYLEIGTRTGEALRRNACAWKHGVDPDPNAVATHHMTSDEYFSGDPMIPDLAFIDGLHTQAQVRKDWQNIKTLNPDAVIVFHDCWPVGPHTVQEEKPNNGEPWNGSVWKEWAWIVQRFPESYCVDCDHGCGVLLGKVRFIYPRSYTIQEYLADRSLAAMITTNEFIQRKHQWTK